LLQPLNDYIPLSEDFDSSSFERLPGSGAIFEQKMSYAFSANDPGTSTFDAYACASEGLTHFSEGGRPVVESDSEILHRLAHCGCTRQRWITTGAERVV